MRRRVDVRSSTWSVACLLLSGCFTAELGGGPSSQGNDDSDGQASRDASSPSSRGTVDAGPDSGFLAAHPACTTSPPTTLPTLDEVSATAYAARVNAWQASCADASAPAPCGPDRACEDAVAPVCIRDREDGEGFCGTDPFFVLPSDLVPLAYREGECIVLVAPADRATACCAAMPGFDCRTYPFATKSRPGELCRVHEDCEEGLLCGPGVCVCPGANLASPPRHCLPYHGGVAWHSEHLPARDAGACFPTRNGFHAVVLDDEVADAPFFAAIAPDGSLHELHTGAQGFRHLTNESGSWVVDAPNLLPSVDEPWLTYTATAMAIDTNGALHLVLDAGGPSHATNRSGSWTVTPIPYTTSSDIIGRIYGAISFDERGEMTLALVDQATGVIGLAVPNESGFDVRDVSLEYFPPTRLKMWQTTDAWHLLLETANAAYASPAQHFVFTRDGTQRNELAGLPFVDVLGSNGSLAAAAAPSESPGQVWVGTLDSGALDGRPVWEQPTSRQQRRAVPVRVAAASDGTLFVTHAMPEGRLLHTIGADGSVTSVLVTTDRSDAELVVDADDRPHLFVLSGGAIYLLSEEACP